MTTRLALIGLGKIARDQHLPAIAGNSRFELVAIVDPAPTGIHDLAYFRDIQDLITSGLAVDAIVLCTPPQVRRAVAVQAIDAGLHVFLEKPPSATLSEIDYLRSKADAAGVTLFSSWHSRFAQGVEPARAWLADRTIDSVSITWREDVRVWHPGQTWLWEAGGFGVFDPGINALSIATHILPRALFVEDAELDFPANRAAPIAARLQMSDEMGVQVLMDLDFRQQGEQSWDIAIATDVGTLQLVKGGSVLLLPSGFETSTAAVADQEYERLYARFADLIDRGVSDVDTRPLQLVADAFLRGRRTTVAPFFE